MIASGQDRDTKVAEARAIMEAFNSSEDIERWARTRRFLHTFSLSNQILLQVQVAFRMRDASLEEAWSLGQDDDALWFPIQAAWRWRKSGFFPAQTASLPTPARGALWVWAPQTMKKAADGSWMCRTCRVRVHGPRCQQGHTRQKVFVLKPVFSRLQVVDQAGEQPPLAPEPQPLTGDSHAHMIAPLVDWLREELRVTAAVGVTPAEDRELERAGGYFDRAERRVVVRLGPPNEMLATLIHEAAHACGVDYSTYERAHAEAIVESAAYLACAALGLDVGARSLPYVAGWGAAGGENPSVVLRAHAKLIDDLARRLEAPCRPTTTTEEEAA